MFEQFRQLFWSVFGSPEPQIEHVSHDSETLQALCNFYGRNIKTAHCLLRPLFPTEYLGNSSWLNDDCLNDFLEALVCDYTKQGIKVGFVDSHKSQPGTRTFIFKGLNLRYKKDEAALTPADLIFCPVNLTGDHWGLWVLDKRDEHNHQVYGLDGFNCNPFVEHSEDSDNAQYVDQQEMYYEEYIKPLAEKFGFNTNKAHYHYIPEQRNTIDCGAVVCYWVKQICENARDINSPFDLDFEADNYTEFRLDIAKTILSHHSGSAVKRAAQDVHTDDETLSRARKKPRI